MNRNLLLGIIGGVILLALAVLYFSTGNRQKSFQASSKETVKTDPCAEAVIIAQQQAEINRLNEKLTELYACYENCLESQIPKTTFRAITTAVRPATTPTPRTATPAVPALKTDLTPPTAAIRPPATIGKANLDGLRQNGIIPFCVMVNGNGGWHFPQLAIEKGVSFPRTAKNPTGDGTNWVVEQTEWMEGDYGVTDDGIFYVADSFLSTIVKTQVTQVTMKAPLIREMKKEGAYWVFKAV